MEQMDIRNCFDFERENSGVDDLVDDIYSFDQEERYSKKAKLELNDVVITAVPEAELVSDTSDYCEPSAGESSDVDEEQKQQTEDKFAGCDDDSAIFNEDFQTSYAPDEDDSIEDKDKDGPGENLETSEVLSKRADIIFSLKDFLEKGIEVNDHNDKIDENNANSDNENFLPENTGERLLEGDDHRGKDGQGSSLDENHCNKQINNFIGQSSATTKSVNYDSPISANLQFNESNNLAATDPGNLESIPFENLKTKKLESNNPGNLESVNPKNVDSSDPTKSESTNSENLEPTTNSESLPSTNSENFESANSENLGLTNSVKEANVSTSKSILQNISISVVGGGGGNKDINIESLLSTKTDLSTNVHDLDPPTNIHRIFQASSGISIKKQSDELENRLSSSEEVLEKIDQEEKNDEEDEDPEPVVNEARQYDVCMHGDLSEYSCADCSYNRWRSERDFARNNSKKWKRTKSKIIEEVDWYEVFNMPDTEEQEIPEENDNLVVQASVKNNIEVAKQNTNCNEKKKICQDTKEPKKGKKIKNEKQKIDNQAKDSDQIKETKKPDNPDSANAAESKGSLGGTVQEVVANSVYFSKFPKQIKKGPTVDDRFGQDPTLPAGWLVREFSLQCRKNGRTDKEYRAPDCMVFRSKKSIIEYMKYVGIQPDQKCL